MIKTISPQNAFEMLSSGQAVLIDVREPDEFLSEHIAYGLSIPLSIFEHEFSSLDFPAEKKILFQCLKGKRGEKACILASNIEGIENEILNIEGGILGWKEQKLPVVMNTSSGGISIFRQVQIIVGGLIAFLVALGLAGLTFGFIIAGVLGATLFFAGATGWCGLAMLLSKMPWNKVNT